jgi:hypothetical protein
MAGAAPCLELAELKSGRWCVALKRPSGAVEQIGDFATAEDAARWIERDATAWLGKHPAGGVCATCGGSGEVVEARAPRPGVRLSRADCETCGGWGRTLA